MMELCFVLDIERVILNALFHRAGSRSKIGARLWEKNINKFLRVNKLCHTLRRIMNFKIIKIAKYILFSSIYVARL